MFPGEAKAGEFSAAAKAQVPGPVEAQFLDPARPGRGFRRCGQTSAGKLWGEPRRALWERGGPGVLYHI